MDTRHCTIVLTTTKHDFAHILQGAVDADVVKRESVVERAHVAVRDLYPECLPAVSFRIVLGGRRVADNARLAARELVTPIGHETLLAGY